ncbi:MAG: hypothetical protein V1749_08285 [Candidatus Desantisbacteria bacterium]
MKSLTSLVLGVLLFCMGINISVVDGHELGNTITFENQSGELAFVKLVGPTTQSVEVPHSESRMMKVAAGEYYTLVRYGNTPKQYTYSKGEPFTVTETVIQYSAITITLHKVVDGNYSTYPTSQKEFDKVTADTNIEKQEKNEGEKTVGGFAEEPFVIRDKRFTESFIPDAKPSNVAIKITTEEGGYTIGGEDEYTMAMYMGKWTIWGNGSKHTWIGKNTYKGFTFDSDKNDPLQFMVDKDKGYVYVKGKGVVTTHEGKTIGLPLEKSQVEDTRQFVVKAQLYPYTSLCEFPDSKNWPRTIMWEGAVSITLKGCSDLEKTLVHPSAILITIVNLGDFDIEIPIEGFNSVILTKKDSKKIPAIAWRYRERNSFGYGLGYSIGFVTKCSGKIVVIIKPRESCDLIFLFPSAETGELISIAGLAPVKITE